MMLRQMYEEVVHNKPKTSHVGDPLGGKRPNATKPKPGMSICHTQTVVLFACMHDAMVNAKTLVYAKWPWYWAAFQVASNVTGSVRASLHWLELQCAFTACHS